jgi:hypothetical protein
MIAAGLQGVDFIAANTEALIMSKAKRINPVGHPGDRMPLCEGGSLSWRQNSRSL